MLNIVLSWVSFCFLLTNIRDNLVAVPFHATFKFENISFRKPYIEPSVLALNKNASLQLLEVWSICFGGVSGINIRHGSCGADCPGRWWVTIPGGVEEKDGCGTEGRGLEQSQAWTDGWADDPDGPSNTDDLILWFSDSCLSDTILTSKILVTFIKNMESYPSATLPFWSHFFLHSAYFYLFILLNRYF